MDVFVGWSRDQLIAEITRLRLQLKRKTEEASYDSWRLSYLQEERAREEERKRGEQRIFG